MSDTTKIIPPPRRGPRWIDLILAAVAGGLLTLLLIGVLLGGGLSRLAGTTASPSPSAERRLTSPSATIQIRTAAPTTAAPSPSTAAPTTAAPTTAAPTATATAAPTNTAAPTPPRTNTPAPTRTP